MTAIVDFYFGPGSRYSYIASTQTARVERETGCRFRWLPLQSGPLISHDGRDPFAPTGEPGRQAPSSGQYDWDYRKRDAMNWADYYDIPYREPVDRLSFDARLAALACCAAERQGAAESCSRKIMTLIFIDDRTTISPEDLESAVKADGLDVARFRIDLASDSLRQDHDARVREAACRGAFGVPTFFLGDRMFWGNDRLALLEAALKRQI